MRYQAFGRAAAAVLATAIFGAGAASAQTQPQPAVLTDTAPLPASERGSMGAVILMDQPVLAQREAMAAAQERGVDTRSMGAGPNRILRETRAQELEMQKALEDALRQEQSK